MKRITVLGATGYTGILICRLLDEAKLDFNVAARSVEKLEKYDHAKKVLKVDVLNLPEVTALLDETDILINCVGPYGVFSKLIIQEVAKRKISYLDLTGEQSFVKNSLAAKDIKATLIHSCSFESALADLLCFKFLDQKKKYDSINTFYYFESATPSPGTRFTMKVHGYFDQWFVQQGQLQKVDKAFALKGLKIPEIKETDALFTPYPEILFINKHFHPKFCGSFLLMEKGMIELALAKNHSAGELEDTIKKLSAPSNYKGPTEADRAKQFFKFAVQAQDENGLVTTSVLSGNDMYLLTAGLAVGAVKRLLKEDFKAGALTPAEAFYNSGLLEEVIQDFHLKLSNHQGAD